MNRHCIKSKFLNLQAQYFQTRETFYVSFEYIYFVFGKAINCSIINCFHETVTFSINESVKLICFSFARILTALCLLRDVGQGTHQIIGEGLFLHKFALSFYPFTSQGLLNFISMKTYYMFVYLHRFYFQTFPA